MTTIYIIGFIISIVMLVLYIILVAKVSGISKNVKKESCEYWYRMYHKHMYWNERDQALCALKEIIWIEWEKVNHPNTGPEQGYKKIRERFEKAVIELGGVFPEYTSPNSSSPGMT